MQQYKECQYIYSVALRQILLFWTSGFK